MLRVLLRTAQKKFYFYFVVGINLLCFTQSNCHSGIESSTGKMISFQDAQWLGRQLAYLLLRWGTDNYFWKNLIFFQMYLNWGSSNQNDLLKLIIQGRILNEKRFSDQEHVFFTEFVSGRKMAIVSCLCLMVARCSLTVKTFLYEENLDNVERS